MRYTSRFCVNVVRCVRMALALWRVHVRLLIRQKCVLLNTTRDDLLFERPRHFKIGTNRIAGVNSPVICALPLWDKGGLLLLSNRAPPAESGRY